MNKKRLIGLIALVLIVALTAVLFTACSKFKPVDSVSGGDPNGVIVSNGGYYVEQGGYAYFINGYDAGDSSQTVAVNNEWGNPLKNGIVRVTLNSDGSYDNSTAVRVVPKQIYNTSKSGGFAIFGEWIYYATPNNDRDKGGNPSTTHTDFMRTKIDGTITQLIGTINTRSAEYLFTPTRILYYTTGTSYDVNFIDFSGMKTNKSSDNGKGTYSGVLLSAVSNVMWGYDSEWTRGQGVVASDYIFFTETSTDESESYEFCNKLCAIRYDGQDRRVLADKFSYLTDEEKEDYVSFFPTKVFNFTLVGFKVESDNKVALYYTKATYVNGANSATGLYVNRFTLDGGFSATDERHLTHANPTAVFALSYEDGALITRSNGYYYHVKEDVAQVADVYANLVIGRSATVQHVIGDTVYYTDSTGGRVYAISLSENGSLVNETVILNASFYADWLNFEFSKGKFFFFDSADYYYLHVADLTAFNGEDITTEFLGIMTQADADAKAEAEKKDEE